MDHSLPTSLSQAEEPAPQRGRIAVVEDGAETRYFVVQALRSQGYHVKGIEDGSGALPLLRLQLPDVILLDVNMPGLSGLEVCRADPCRSFGAQRHCHPAHRAGQRGRSRRRLAGRGG